MMTVCEGVFAIMLLLYFAITPLRHYYNLYYCFSIRTLGCCYCLISADVCAVLLINPTIAVTTKAIVKVGNVAPIVLSLCNI